MLHSRTPSSEDRRHQHQQQQPPVIPPSPTLSNPDMILPFDQSERESQTPSPPFNLPSLSNLQSFYENRAIPSHVSPDSAQPGSGGGGGVGVGYAVTSRAPQKGIPRHTWLHEGHDASRRLSDIGEEDITTPTRFGGFPGSTTPIRLASQDRKLASSPLPRDGKTAQEGETGAWSSSSSSTVSAASESSEGGKTRQQHDGTAGAVPQEGRSLGRSQLSAAVRAIKEGANSNGDGSNAKMVSTTEEGGGADELSSVILSSEAERILDNAKKRLTLMEGNLTRARSSMRLSPSASSSPSPSPSPGGQMGLGQPVGGLYQSISRADRRSSMLRPRATYSSNQDSSNNRHSRVFSETTLPSAAQSSLSVPGPGLSRSMSALGSSSSSNFHNDDRSFHYEPTRAYLTHRASVSSLRPPAHYSSSPSEEHTPDTHGLGISTENVDHKPSNMEEFNSAYPLQDPPSRSQSQLQVRDLQDQMKGLHIKISSLKVKAQEDGLRRRSLQSLRTPSPLTAAEHWYTKDMEYKDHTSHLSPVAGYRRVREYAPEARNSNSGESGSSREQQDGVKSPRQPEAIPTEPPAEQAPAEPQATNETAENDDTQSVVESLYEDAEEGEYDNDGPEEIDREALNEILREPLDEDLEDSVEAFPDAPTDSTPHEDREDAFDYEHFILHSALGNYTQRMRRDSGSSDTSVETTRPIQSRRSLRHSRTSSSTSLSTVATFATATEGADDDFEGVLYWDRRFNHELRHRQSFPDEDDAGSEMGTPRAVKRRSSQRSTKSARSSRGAKLSDEHLVIPERPESSLNDGSATPTSLASSLVSTVRAASSPHPHSVQNGHTGINDDDERLLEQLFASLGTVCTDLQNIASAEEPDEKQVRLLRRRLDNARRVLDGELDT